MTNLDKLHLYGVKWIFKYMKGTSDVCLEFRHKTSDSTRYVDSNFAGDLDKSRSLTRYVFLLGGYAISLRPSL